MKDIFKVLAVGKTPQDLRALMRPPVFILEEIVGPIRDAFDSEVPRIRQTKPNTHEVDASCPPGIVKRELDLKYKEARFGRPES